MPAVLRGKLELRTLPERREPRTRPAKVAQLLALAHRWQRQLDAGEVRSQAAIAAREGVTPARVSQVMALLSLSPWRQEEVLGMVATDGVEPVGEKEVRAESVDAPWARLGAPGAPAYGRGQLSSTALRSTDQSLK